MKSIKELSKNFKSDPSECLGIDVGENVVKIVRLKSSGDGLAITGAELLKSDDGSITIPSHLRTRYASIATDENNAIIKLLTFSGAIDELFEKELPQKLGLSNEKDYRIGHRIITKGHARNDSSILAVAIPKNQAKQLMLNFVSGLPAPYSLEHSSTAALTTFEHHTLENAPDNTTGLINFGTNTTSLAIFHKKKLVLLRFFDFGTNVVLEKIQSSLKVNIATAYSILDDASFDVSDMLTELMGTIASQLIVSRDFIERQNNCSIGMLYAVGGIALSDIAMKSLGKAMNVDISAWDPFDGISITSQALRPDIDEQHWRFAAAVGAALATLEKK